MAFTPFTTHEMLGVIRNVPKPSSFWLNLAFKRQVNSQSSYIDFDRLTRGRRIAPFVAPTAQGKPMRSEGFTVERFKPAYIKPKHILDPERLITRMAGEAYQGSMSLAARRDAIMVDLLTEQDEMITRRLELMAAQAVMDGQVIVEGEDYPRVVVDFNRHADQTITLTGTDLWTDTANSNPYDDFEAWSTQTSLLSGYQIKDWYLGANAWKALYNHPATKELLNTDFRNGNAELQGGPGNVAEGGEAMVQLKGTVGVGHRIWTYSDIYEDEDGEIVQIMDPDAVVGVNAGALMGVQAYGAIMDARAGYQSLSRFPKNWMNEDPAVEYVMTQSAPLMVPMVPNASLKATVV